MGIIRCIAITCIVLNTIQSQVIRRREDSKYSRTINNAEEQSHSSRHLMFLEDTAVATWTEWGSPTKCSSSCGQPGYYELIRNCSTGVLGNCEATGGRYWSISVCDNGPCTPIWTEWSAESTCSQTCAIGVSVRYRNCSTGNDPDCTSGKNYVLQACDAGPCNGRVSTTVRETISTTTAVPGLWSEWSRAVSCSATCGSGFGELTRTCSTGQNADCVGRYWSINACNNGECQVDGFWGPWQEWSSCLVTCGGGQIARSRLCEYPDPNVRGDPCQGVSMDSKACNTDKCAVDGTWTGWTSWSQCSMTCDDGLRSRTRTCSFPNDTPRGNGCFGPADDNSTCKEADCAVDGHWAAWTAWSMCTKTCNNGLKFRGRTCHFNDAKPRGSRCSGSQVDRTSCNEAPCSVDGTWSDWSSWTQCTHSCDGGKQSRSRVCSFTTGSLHGADCPGDTREFQDCGLQGCPVDGVWDAWAPWATCSQTCGGGTQVKTRTCQYRGLGSNSPHGRPCDGESQKSQTCKAELCPVDGKWSIWSSFGPCNATCGGGFRIKTRTCKYDLVAPIGRNCTGNPEFSEQCNPQTCPVDGKLLAWEAWSHCTATCDGGTRYRTRQCYFPSNVPHGANCAGAMRDDDVCNDSPCPTTTTTTTEAPVDGHWSKLGPWSDCTLTCDGGIHTRYRNCTYPDLSLHGQFCVGPANETQPCNQQHCPVDGAWSTWSVYSRCSATCENGTRVRTRTCKFVDRYPHGENCSGITQEIGNCWAGDCPVDGVWAAWANWHACSVTCGGGIHERTRICFFQKDKPHGSNCTGESHNKQPCATEYCPVDGTLSLWTTWTPCPVTCGGSMQSRNRTCDFHADRPRGNNCTGNLDQVLPCSSNHCPVDGHWEAWQAWETCSATCGGGLETRKRKCIYDKIAPHGQICNGHTSESKDCNTNTCPVDGLWAPWELWTTCSVSCENGSHTRQRTCLYPDGKPHGNNCTGNSSELETCNDGKCPVDGKLSGWTVWSVCTVTCGNGTQTRNRSCDFPDGIPHGKACTGPTSNAAVCNTDICPVDGKFGSWSKWTVCSVTCGGGTEVRQRSCVFDAIAPHGNNCTGRYTDTRTCNPNNCPVDGSWSGWSNFTACTVSCGSGTRFRARKCEFRPVGYPHGNNCTGTDEDTEVCGTDICPVDGTPSAWSAWTACTKSCENGTRAHNRTCEFDVRVPRGNNCTGDLFATQSCNEEKCPINGHWSIWSKYTDCTVTCAGGTRVRNRTCLYDNQAPHGSACFGNVTDIRDCNTQHCPVDGQWGAWNSWNPCDKTCGGGQRARDRDCQYQFGIAHGKNCTGGPTLDISECNNQTCPVDGTWSGWSRWTDCSASCGGGVRYHNRKCDFPSDTPHGSNCTGEDSGHEVCNTTACPVDGVWSTWTVWTQCPVTCGGGSQSRDRNCTFNIDSSHPAPFGKNCTGSYTDTQTCNNVTCPVDGTWSKWSMFSACTLTCGNGTSSRTRSCEYLPQGTPKGNNCNGPTMEAKSCNETECPLDAVLTDWSTWTNCIATCGGGNQTRTRQCNWPSSVHGNTCTGDTEESKGCNPGLCPVDGVWAVWNEWVECSGACFGKSQRTRNCTYKASSPHGARCPGTHMEERFCHGKHCVVDGQWTKWRTWSTCSVTCGLGNKTRTRTCAFPLANAVHGKNCTGDNIEARPCDNTTECAVDGTWGTWGPWNTCSVTCGHGDKHRTRACVFDPAKPRGHDCPKGSENETQSCTLHSCPVDAMWTTWGGWNTCTVTCGGGKQQRHRACHFQPHVPPGDYCPGAEVEEQTCHNTTCPVTTTESTTLVTSPEGTTETTTIPTKATTETTTLVTSPVGTTETTTIPTKATTESTTLVTSPGGTAETTTIPISPGGTTETTTIPITTAQSTRIITSTTVSSTSLATTVDPIPDIPRSCYQCTGPKILCEKIHGPVQCPLDKRYCINSVENRIDTSRTVDMRCGTKQECQTGWFETYSSKDKCTRFSIDFIYTYDFYCEFCCNTDNCNKKINPEQKWHP